MFGVFRLGALPAVLTFVPETSQRMLNQRIPNVCVDTLQEHLDSIRGLHLDVKVLQLIVLHADSARGARRIHVIHSANPFDTTLDIRLQIVPMFVPCHTARSCHSLNLDKQHMKRGCGEEHAGYSRGKPEKTMHIPRGIPSRPPTS